MPSFYKLTAIYLRDTPLELPVGRCPCGDQVWSQRRSTATAFRTVAVAID
jgi:hypothetical protein